MLPLLTLDDILWALSFSFQSHILSSTIENNDYHRSLLELSHIIGVSTTLELVDVLLLSSRN